MAGMEAQIEKGDAHTFHLYNRKANERNGSGTYKAAYNKYRCKKWRKMRL